MGWQTKTRVGSLAAVLGGLGIILAVLLGLETEAAVWAIAPAVIFGALAGFGCALAVAGLIQRRRAGRSPADKD